MHARHPILRSVAVVSVATLALALGPPGAAQAAPRPAPPSGTTPVLVAGGFLAPLQLAEGRAGKSIYVADGFLGQVTRIDLSRSDTSTATIPVDMEGPSAVAVQGNRMWVVGNDAGFTRTLAAQVDADGSLSHVVDLLAFEREHNPDGQKVLTPQDQPVPPGEEPEGDAESNPYDVLAYQGGIIVVDAAANALIRIDAAGRATVLTAFPLVTTGDCATNPQLLADDTTVYGCDPVPTGIALGPDGYLYVSGLGAFAAGQVWKVDPRSGRIVATLTAGFPPAPPLTDVAVGSDGAVYAASPFAGAVFRLLDGQLSVVELEGAVSLLWSFGTLYVGTAPAVAAESGPPPPGEVYAVPAGAFQPFTPPA